MRGLLLLPAGLALCSAAWAQPASQVPINDIVFSPWDTGERGGDFVVYSNLETPDPNGYYFNQLSAGAPFGDDLHMVSGGLMDGFTFVYLDPEGGDELSQVEVLFYADDPNEPEDYPGGEPASPLLGSYVVSDLPGDGEWIVTVDVSSDPLQLPKDIWMEFDFANNPEAGLRLYHPSTVGHSEIWFEIHGMGIFWFG